MEKILLAINPENININAIEFTSYLAKLTHSKITAIFLEKNQGSEVPVLKTAFGGAYVETILESDLPKSKKIDNQCEQNVRLFENACMNRGVTCCIHRDKGVPVEEVILESRFADMLIVDVEMSFRERAEGLPTAFVKEVLARSECPVVIAPFSFNDVDEIVFAYDGSPSSVFAIKQFTYLLPELSDKKITILQVDEDDDLPTINNTKIRELLRMHYGGIGFHFLHGKASDELFSYLINKKNIFLVMGAFGRSMLSGFFKHSTAELVIKTVNLPVFIAHH